MLSKVPFTIVNGGGSYPLLKITIVNPATGLSVSTFGLIDTGADECAIPAGFARALGHNLQAGITKTIQTGNGATSAYAHTSTIQIHDPLTNVVAHTIQQTPVDFMPNLHVVLLGVRNFLGTFVLTVDYPQQEFSIIRP